MKIVQEYTKTKWDFSRLPRVT